ncbi:MAG: glycosyltransferase [Fimbriimonas sp.]
MSNPIALVTGSLPPEVCGVGDYTSRLHAELDGVDLVHVPIRRAYESALFDIFQGRELVHIEYPTEGWGNSLLPSFLPLAKKRCLLLLTLHEWSQMNRIRRASILPLVSRADGFIFVSEQEREHFAASAPKAARQKPSWVIPIGVNLEVPSLTEEEILAKRAELAGEPFLTHFGFIHAGKQPEKLLDTVEALKRKGKNPHLVFIGDFQKDKTAEKEAFQALLHSRGLAPLVTMLGFVQDDREAALIMAAADASISLFEDGLSPRRGSFWYATQHGRPAITTEPVGEGPENFGELTQFLKPPQVHFVRAGATGQQIADVIESLPPYKPKKHAPIPVPTWRDIATRHKAVYREMLGRG